MCLPLRITVVLLPLALSACVFDRSGVPAAERTILPADLGAVDRAAAEARVDAAADAGGDRAKLDITPREATVSDRGCLASTECGPDQVCSGGACTALFGIAYRITEISATLDCTLGTPDPSVSLTFNVLSPIVSVAPVIKNTCTPHWILSPNEGKIGVINSADFITFFVTDEKSKLPMGAVVFTDLKQGLHAGVLQGANLAVDSLTVKIVPL